MPWVVRDVVRDINKAAGRRWQAADPLLPMPDDLPEGCGAPMVARGANGRPVGLAVCRHQEIPDDSISQTWGTATRFVLTARVGQANAQSALDQLLSQWGDHLAVVPEAGKDDTSALLYWPSRDITGISALLRHGLQPLAVIAARQLGEPARSGEIPRPASWARRGSAGRADRLTIRQAGPGDEAAVTGFELDVVDYEAHFGGAVKRPATRSLIRADVRARLGRPVSWTWLADRAAGPRAEPKASPKAGPKAGPGGGSEGDPAAGPAGMIVVQQPKETRWITGLTGSGPAVYLPTAFVAEPQRGTGVGGALVRYVHEYLDAAGVQVILLHYALVNPVSGPFWSRMGYRPLWTIWETRPASALR